MKSIALALLLLPGAALAQDVTCDPNGPQIALNMCAQQDWDKADAELNRVYKLAVAAMKEMDSYYDDKADKIGESTLREAQRAWVTFRDLACEAESFPFHGGSAEPMVYSSCMANLTRARTADLQTIVDIGGL
jgi:uncharacterized protein YecT (DUF1311 family)